MSWHTLVDAQTLRDALGDPCLVVLDCRFDLADPGSGERAWREAHVPGAHYASLDRDLSDLSRHGRGRHPLPEAAAFCRRLVRWGITPQHHVIACDAGNGMVAARLWWMLRLLGHREVAVLDGGYPAWRARGGPEDRSMPAEGGGNYTAEFDASAIVTVDAVLAGTVVDAGVLLDARAGERFRGEVEPLDPRAGHVPGACNHPFMENLGADGRFLPAERLRARFAALLDGRAPSAVTHMCGSGVSACHNLLAMEHAGLHGSRVYAGSWSEWVSVPDRAVATGPA